MSDFGLAHIKREGYVYIFQTGESFPCRRKHIEKRWTWDERRKNKKLWARIKRELYYKGEDLLSRLR